MDKPLLNGRLHRSSIDNWDVFWETNENYRHWCFQKYSDNDETALFILFNPGTLKNNPDKLSSDPTLRILREVCYKSGINPFVINLFDYCTPSYIELNQNWDKRDYKFLVFEKLLSLKFIFSIYAYGLIDLKDKNYYEIISRINLIKDTFKNIPQLDFDNSKTTHPRRWEIEKKKENIHNVLLAAYKDKKMIISLNHNV
jgi:hypothetical protein